MTASNPAVETTEEVKALPPEVDLGNMDKVADMQFLVSMLQAQQMMNGMSARNIMRAVLTAMTHGVADEFPTKLVHKREAELAGLIAKSLDLRTLVQASKLRKQDETNNNKGNAESQNTGE